MLNLNIFYLVIILHYKLKYLKFYKAKKATIQIVAFGGGKGIRTLDPLRARQVLSQLSYTPKNGGPSGTRTPGRPVMSRLL